MKIMQTVGHWLYDMGKNDSMIKVNFKNKAEYCPYTRHAHTCILGALRIAKT